MRISTLAQRMRMPTRYPTLRLNLSLSELTAHRPQREHGTMITHRSLARSLWKVSRLFMGGGAENLERDPIEARSLLVPTACTPAACLCPSHARQRFARNGL